MIITDWYSMLVYLGCCNCSRSGAMHYVDADGDADDDDDDDDDDDNDNDEAAEPEKKKGGVDDINDEYEWNGVECDHGFVKQ